MDVFIIRAGVVDNIATVDSLETAQQLWPDATVVARTPENAHVGIGDPAP